MHRPHFILLIAVLICGSNAALAQLESAKLKVGFIGSFSGPAQAYGEATKNGFELALKELNTPQLEVFYEDDQFIPARTVTAFKKLTTVDKVDLVVVGGSTPSSAVAPLAQAKRIPLIAWASDRRVSRGRSFVIRSYPSGFVEGARAAEEAKKRGYQRIALFTSNNDYALSWKNGLIASMAKEELVFSEETTGDITDFKPLLLRAREKGAKKIAVCLDPGKSGLLVKQARELGSLDAVFGCEYLHTLDEVKTSKGALVGAWFPTISVLDSFREKYLSTYGNESLVSGAANYYDTAHLIYRTLGAKNSDELLKALLSQGSLEGAVGPFTVRSEADDRFYDIPLVIKEVTKDGFRIVK